MSLKNNIQGTQDVRLEDANSPDAILRAAAMENNPNSALHGKAELLSKTKITDTVIQIELYGGTTGPFLTSTDTRIIDNDVYGDALIPYEFLRFFYTTSGTDWIDMKITKLVSSSSASGGKGAPTTYTYTFEGILLNGADFDDIILNEDVRWSFYAQFPADNRQPSNLYVGDITSSTATFSWEDSTKNLALYHQIKYREWDGTDSAWTLSPIGGWIFGVDIKLEGARWPAATETYLGKHVYWMEFSNPELSQGYKAEGWIEIKDGNFGEVFIVNTGSGYRFIPSIELYSRKLADNTIKSNDIANNISFSVTGNDIDVTAISVPFQTGDKVKVDFNTSPFSELNGIYDIDNITPTSLKILNVSNISGLTGVLSPGGSISLAPVEKPIVPGEIIPNLSKDKYNITGLSPNSTYNITAVSYFDVEAKDFSEYSTNINFTSR